MIDANHPRLSIVRECELTSISRSSFYREPTVETKRRWGYASRRRVVPGDAVVQLATDGAASAS
jgi:hypothetical protein